MRLQGRALHSNGRPGTLRQSVPGRPLPEQIGVGFPDDIRLGAVESDRVVRHGSDSPASGEEVNGLSTLQSFENARTHLVDVQIPWLHPVNSGVVNFDDQNWLSILLGRLRFARSET